MNVVVLTNRGSLFGLKILNALQRRDVPVTAVAVLRQPLDEYRKLFRFVRRRVGTAQALYFSVRRVVQRRPEPRTWEGGPFVAAYDRLAVAVHESEGTNSERTVALLSALAPDLLLLGQTGIVRARVLAIPRIGTLNAHPGLLPDYRGIDCGAWAVHNGDWDKLGNTLHWVDAGVDTGPIVARRPFIVTRPMSLAELEDALYDDGAMLMADCVARMVAGETLPAEPQQPGRQYYKMPLAAERVTRRRLQAPPGWVG